MENCPLCGDKVSPLRLYSHRTSCKGKSKMLSQNRSGRVRSPSTRTSGLVLERQATIDYYSAEFSEDNKRLARIAKETLIKYCL
jgi:hypothetical protein